MKKEEKTHKEKQLKMEFTQDKGVLLTNNCHIYNAQPSARIVSINSRDHIYRSILNRNME